VNYCFMNKCEYPRSRYTKLLMLISIENDVQMEEGKAFENQVMSLDKALEISHMLTFTDSSGELVLSISQRALTLRY